MLKQVMLRSKIKALNIKLTALREKAEGFKTRKEELERALEETETQEELAAVQAELDELAKEIGDEDIQAEIEAISQEIADAEAELEEIAANEEAAAGEEQKGTEPGTEKRFNGGMISMNKRTIVGRMSAQQRAELFSKDSVKTFITNFRDMMSSKRAVTGAELNIPEEFLGVIRDDLDKYSKLIKHVNLKKVKGNSRQVVVGAIPEGIWVEAIASLNELNITFNQVEVDGYKVGGFIPVANSYLEDSDIALGAEIIEMLAQAIGYAADKAILYGTGTHMPIGVVTRLAQTAQPSDYSTKARPWADLHTSNIYKFTAAEKALSGVDFFRTLALKLGLADDKYSHAEAVYCMSKKTKNRIIAESLAFNAAGALVASKENEMPGIGGTIETFDFIPDGDIIGGYFDVYLLAERSGGKISQSEHAQFIEDNTVFKGTARYDGVPVIAEDFVAINIENANVTTSVTFAAVTASSNG
ncbi:MAG: phage major capsid protein [Lachnospiraceae bacterium]|nr:phage major capsid protein [Lachnospiraceae bacterium]